MVSSALDQLQQALQERNIQLNRNDFVRAFNSDETQDELVDWTKEFTSPECLLTSEERALFVRYISSS